MSAAIWIAIATLAFPLAALGQNAPSWSQGRNAAGELVVEGGAHHGTLSFEQERAEYLGPGNNYNPRCSGATDSANGCPTCNAIVWNSTLDNYLPGGTSAADVSHMNTNSNFKYLLVKNSRFQNAWLCRGGPWSGPNGHQCAAGEVSSFHTDVFQLFSPPEDGGWAVFQDSSLINGDQQIGIWSTPDTHRGRYVNGTGICSDPGGAGSMAWQNVRIGNTQSQGAATQFISDCKARGSSWSCDSGNQFVTSFTKDDQFKAFWLIDVQRISNAKIRVVEGLRKIVVIGGSGGSNGWPGPLGPGATPNTGASCPNGPIAARYAENDTAFRVYCYDSIENAVAAGHEAPPFIHLSASGWANPPTTALAPADPPTDSQPNQTQPSTPEASPNGSYLGRYAFGHDSVEAAAWFSTGQGNALTQDQSLFSIAAIGSKRALMTRSSLTNIHSHARTGDLFGWSNYEYRGTMMRDSSDGGIGITLYSHYPAADAYYRIRSRNAGEALHMAAHPQGQMNVACNTATTAPSPSPNVWYRFRVQALTSAAAAATIIKAKVWPEGSAEPGPWAIDCRHDEANRLGFGTVGVWSMGPGGKYWDDLEIERLDQGAASTRPLPPVLLETYD